MCAYVFVCACVFAQCCVCLIGAKKETGQIVAAGRRGCEAANTQEMEDEASICLCARVPEGVVVSHGSGQCVAPISKNIGSRASWCPPPAPTLSVSAAPRIS